MVVRSPRSTRSRTVFERMTYRRARAIDAARILPFAGLGLWLLPVLWVRNRLIGTAGESLYIFALWALMILAAAILARALRAPRLSAPPVADDADELAGGGAFSVLHDAPASACTEQNTPEEAGTGASSQ